VEPTISTRIGSHARGVAFSTAKASLGDVKMLAATAREDVFVIASLLIVQLLPARLYRPAQHNQLAALRAGPGAAESFAPLAAMAQ
jgi:hypothetical protein